MLSKWRDRIDLGMIMELIKEIANPGDDSNVDGKKSDDERKEEGKVKEVQNESKTKVRKQQ